MSPETTDANPLEEALKRLASSQIELDDLRKLQDALASGQVSIESASKGGIVIKGNVSGGTITTTTTSTSTSITIKLPSEFLKLLQPAYKPPVPPPEKMLAERDVLPPGSRLSFAPNAVFTGREEGLKYLAHELLYADVTPAPAGVVVTGYGGVGKSQLAAEFCYRYGRFFQGVHWIQANQDIMAEISACGEVMGLPCWPDKLPEQIQATLRAWQLDSHRLIVLDNAEDLDVVEDWLTKFQPARVLITSRRDKDRWPADLGLHILMLDVLTRIQSKELLCKLAARLKKQPDNDLDKLAQYLGDLPLALDLAGRYLQDRSELTIKGYLAELDKAGNALDHKSLKDWADHSPTKHATSLAATFALSWEQLNQSDELARRLFRIGGFCAPNIPVPRQIFAETLGPEISDPDMDKAMRKLDSLGLMQRADGGRRMHTLLAEFAKLKDQEAELSTLPALANAMVSLTTQALESGLPERTSSLREHLDVIAQFAEKAELP